MRYTEKDLKTSTAVCIDCAEDVILNSSVEINCLSEGTGKMNYF